MERNNNETRRSAAASGLYSILYLVVGEDARSLGGRESRLPNYVNSHDRELKIIKVLANHDGDGDVFVFVSTHLTAKN